MSCQSKFAHVFLFFLSAFRLATPLSYWPRPICSGPHWSLFLSDFIPLFHSLGVDLEKKKKKKKQKPRNYSWSTILFTLPLHIGSEDDGSHLFIFHSVISHFKLPRPQEGKTEWGGVKKWLSKLNCSTPAWPFGNWTSLEASLLPGTFEPLDF